MTIEAQRAQNPAQVRQDCLDQLDSLAEALARRGLRARLVTPAGRLPSLHAVNPAAPALAEDIYAGPVPGQRLVVLVVLGRADRGLRRRRGRRPPDQPRPGRPPRRGPVRGLTADQLPKALGGKPGKATVRPRQEAARPAAAAMARAPNCRTAGSLTATTPR